VDAKLASYDADLFVQAVKAVVEGKPMPTEETLLGAFFDVQNLKEVAGSYRKREESAPTQPARRQPTTGLLWQRRWALRVTRPGDRAGDPDTAAAKPRRG
jgi:hypothetical protein